MRGSGDAPLSEQFRLARTKNLVENDGLPWERRLRGEFKKSGVPALEIIRFKKQNFGSAYETGPIPERGRFLRR